MDKGRDGNDDNLPYYDDTSHSIIWDMETSTSQILILY
jgi:hypothetical protein